MAHRQVPTLDPFSYASADRPWIDVQWLFQVILAAAHGAGGVPGIILLTAGMCAAISLVGSTARDCRWPSWVGAACWLPALALLSGRVPPRPEIFSLLGVAAYLAVLLRANDNPAWVWALPLIQVVWVNTHALFVLGPIASACVHLLVSPKREFSADRYAAKLCDSPHGLADALLRLEQAAELVEFEGSPASEPMFTINPFAENGLGALFVTHPPVA